MRGVVTLLACIAPFALHFSVLGKSSGAMAFFSFMIALNFALYSVGRRLPWWVLLAAVATVIFLIAAHRELALHLAVLPPVLIYVLFGWVFGRTLVRSRMPLIQRIAEMEHGGALPAEMIGYARGVTWAWTIFFTGMTVLSLLLSQLAAPAVWSFFTNVFGYAAMLVLFVGEYWLRVRRFPDYPFANPLRVAINVTRRAPEVFR